MLISQKNISWNWNFNEYNFRKLISIQCWIILIAYITFLNCIFFIKQMDCWCISHSIYRTIGQMPILITLYYDSIIHFFLVFAKWKSHYSFYNLVTFLWPLKPIHAHHPVPWSSDFCSYVCWMKLGKRMWKCPTKSETILQFAKLNFFKKIISFTYQL